MPASNTSGGCNVSENEYYKAQARPADIVFDGASYFDADGQLRQLTEVLCDGDSGLPLAWVVPKLLSEEECDECIAMGESHGLDPSRFGTRRTSKRTSMYMNEELATRVAAYLPTELKEAMKQQDGRDVSGIHANWRIVRYDQGDAFPAHFDQSDSKQIRNDDGTKDLLFSSHTLLINLSGSDKLEGGETRFYPHGNYDYAIDVKLPRGWGLIFRQRGMLHAGQPILQGVKYVAQAGILRFVPVNERVKPSIFRFGPGLQGWPQQ